MHYRAYAHGFIPFGIRTASVFGQGPFVLYIHLRLRVCRALLVRMPHVLYGPRDKPSTQADEARNPRFARGRVNARTRAPGHV